MDKPLQMHNAKDDSFSQAIIIHMIILVTI